MAQVDRMSPWSTGDTFCGQWTISWRKLQISTCCVVWAAPQSQCRAAAGRCLDPSPPHRSPPLMWLQHLLDHNHPGSQWGFDQTGFGVGEGTLLTPAGGDVWMYGWMVGGSGLWIAPQRIGMRREHCNMKCIIIARFNSLWISILHFYQHRPAFAAFLKTPPLCGDASGLVIQL